MANRVDEFTGSMPGFEGYDPNKAEGVFDEKDIASTLNSVGEAAQGKLSSFNLVTGAAQTNFRNSITPSGSINKDGQFEFASANYDAMDDPNVLAAAKDIGLSEAGARGTAGLVLAPLLLMDAGYRATNTVVGGTVLLGADAVPTNIAAREMGITKGSTINPLYGDGFQLSDIPDTYKLMWGVDQAAIGRDGMPIVDDKGNEVTEVNAITAGQAITIGVGVSWLNALDLVTPGDLRGSIDEGVLEDSLEKLKDPENTRDLLDWKWGLHTEFDLGNLKQRDSALNQGLGRWISGAADSAVLWWAAPEVIGLKVAGVAARSLFVRSIGDLSDINVLNKSLSQHSDFMRGAQNGKRTAVGQLVESLARMNADQIARHKIATTSTDAPLIARTFGPATTFDDAALRLRAISGDKAAIAKLMESDAVVADTLSLQMETLQRTTRELGILEDSAVEIAKDFVDDVGMGIAVNNDSMAATNRAIAIIKAEADQADLVLQAAVKENKVLEVALAGIGREAQMPNAVSLRKLEISRLGAGPLSAGRMEKKAIKAVSKQNGENLWFVKSAKAGGKFGRQIRVWHAGVDYMKTHRMKGLIDLNDSNDVIAEADGMIQTLPMFRRLAKTQIDEAFMPGTNNTVRVGEFRRRFYSQLNAATNATDRMVIWENFEKQLWNSLAAEYNLSSEAAALLLLKYRGVRETVIDTVKQKGLISQDGEVHVLKDMQSILAEKMPTIDFHFVENIFRLETKSGLQRAKGWSDIKGSRASANIDAFWRPLVLLRLGYTTRNVLEGNLRELASFKTVGILSDRKMGTTAIEKSLAWRAGDGFARSALRIGNMRKGRIRKKRLDLEHKQRIAIKTQEELAEAEGVLDATAAEITKRYEAADQAARSTLTDEFRSVTKNRTSVTTEQVNTEVTGEMTAMADDAVEVVIPGRYILPLFAGTSRRRHKFVAGFDTPQEAQVRVAMADSTDIANATTDPKLQGQLADENPLSPYPPEGLLGQTEEELTSNIRNWLNPRDVKQWDEILSRHQEQGGIYPDQLDMYNRLVDKAARGAVYRSMQNGDVVVRTIDPRTGTYEIINDFKQISVDDLNNDLIGILQKEQLKNVEYVRANVFGSHMDLRASQIDLPVGTGGGNSYDELSELMDIGSAVNRLIGDDATKQRDLGIIENLLDMTRSDPDLAAALRLKILVNKMPPHMKRYFEESGTVIDTKEIKRLLKLQKKGVDRYNQTRTKNKEKVQKFTDELRLKYWTDENGKALTPEEFEKLIPSVDEELMNLVFHGGPRVPGDVLDIDPVLTAENLSNLMGMGFYTTRDPGIGVSYIFNRRDELTGEEVLYRAILPDGGESRFIDLDAPMEVGNAPGMGSPDEIVENEQFLQEIFGEMFEDFAEQNPDLVRGLDINEDFDVLWQRVDDHAAEMVVAQETAPPLGVDPRTYPVNMNDYRIAMDNFFLDLHLGADDAGSYKNGLASKLRNFGGNLSRGKLGADESVEQAYKTQMLWVSALRNQGALGVKHVGGRANNTRAHDVFVWYEVPEIQPISEVTADMLRLALVKKQADELLENTRVAEQTAFRNLNDKVNFNNYRPRGLDASNLNAQQKAKIVEYMRGHGVGTLSLDDALSPSGRTILSSPDMVAVSTDQAEAAIPSQMIGKDFVDRTLPQLEQEAMVRQPSVLKSSQMQDDELLPFLGNDPELVAVVRGSGKGTPEQNAKLATILESSGYSHIQVGTFGSGSSKFVNTADLVANKKTGVAYGAMLGESELAQTRNMILNNSDDWDRLHSEWESQSSALSGKRQQLDAEIEQAKASAKNLESRLGRRASGKPLKGGLGTGTERFIGDFKEFERPGPLNVNSQGSMYSELTSSSNTNLANLYGYTDYAMMKLRKSRQLVDVAPGTPDYFKSMAQQLNSYHRNDWISKKILAGESDDEIINWLMTDEIGRKYVRDVHAFDELKGLGLDPAQLTDDARNDMIDLILERRNTLNELVPDEDILRRLVDNEITPDFLQTRMGWRTDLPTLRDGALIDNNRGYIKNFLGAAMHTIGALPEDALVRHPFFRTRWREEMQRQADLQSSQGVKEFSEAQINAMDRVAKKYAVQQVNQSLYTIQRLSTPAHIFKFIIPFFPAWASAMRFWMLQVPAKHPEAIARYAMLYNSPESAGWVYDMDGNKVTGEDSFSGRMTNKLFGGGEGSIVVQFNSQAARDRLAKFTGGMTELKVPTGSFDFMLQGENPFMPGLHPWLVVPATYMASRRPDIATAFETGDIKSVPFFEDFVGDELNEWLMSKNITEPLYKMAIPFGRPTQEKSIMNIVTDTFAPGTVNKLITLQRGMSSVAFSNSAKEIHRTQMTDWELDTNPDKGPAPEFMEAIEKAETYYWFRAFMSATMPFSVNAVTPYTFYIQESRRIDREVYDNGGTYNDASLKFLKLHGSTFFRYRVSLTGGSSGMGANVGEFKEFERDPQLMASLADIGDKDASFITMATRPFQDSSNEDGFDPAVYAWQQKRKIEGTTGKYIRGGEQAESPETRSNRELGWIEYNKVAEMLDALAEERDTTVSADPQLAATKLAMVEKLGADYPDWFEAYNDPKTNRWVQSNTALEMMFDSGYFETHKNHPIAGDYANAMLQYRSLRAAFGQILKKRDQEGGSANVDAKSNLDVAAAWEQMMNELKRSDSTGNFTNAYERFFANDTLAPIPALEAANG